MIDEAGARQRVKPVADREPVVTVTQIEDVVARIARIPPKTVSSSDRDVLRNLERNLKLVIFGQDKAIETLSAAIKMSRSGLGDQRKPVGSFLFAGPTGVGKTEVTRQLAAVLGVELVRFDMSEYMERHTVSRLIGAPPGYVGFDQGGLLTEAITKHPHCVLLLDEIEKAHPDVFNLLLQVMDHGTLTDNNGRKADFRHVMIVMTTNAGAAEMSRASIGFVAPDNAPDGMEAIRRLFAPEFRNRLDAIVQFEPLDERTIERVVDKLLVEVEAQLEQKGVALHLSTTRPGPGSRSAATTRRWAPGRWRASSRSTSSGRSPRNCCSAGWPRAATRSSRRRRTGSSSRSRRGRRRSPRCSNRKRGSDQRIAGSAETEGPVNPALFTAATIR